MSGLNARLIKLLSDGWWVTFDRNLETGQFCSILNNAELTDSIHEEADTLMKSFMNAVKQIPSK